MKSKMLLTKIARACIDNDKKTFAELIKEQGCSFDDYIDARELGREKHLLYHNTTVLCIANEYSPVYYVKELLENGAIPYLSDGFYDTPLHKACRSSTDVIQKVDLLISSNKDLLSRRNEKGNTPLHIAAMSDNEALPQRLLEKGAVVNALSKKFLTPLHIASQYGKQKIVDVFLLHPDIDVNIRDENGDTPLHYASKNGHFKIIENLKQNPKCNQSITNNCGFTADQENPLNLMLLVKAQLGSAREVQAQINYGAICISDHGGDTPLHKTCQSNTEELEKAELLVAFDYTQLHEPNLQKEFPIHIAAKHKNTQLLHFLMNKMDKSIFLSGQPAALRIAVKFGNIHNVKLLVDDDINASVQDEFKRKTTVLCFASQYSTAEFVEVLLSYGANTKSADYLDDTPLHKACRSVNDSKKKLNILLRQDRCLIECNNRNGVNPLHVAARRTDHTIAQLLLEKGADPNVLTKNFLSPLHVAAHFGKAKIVDMLLLQPSIDVNLQDNQGDTPMHHAAARGFVAILNTIKNHHGSITCLTNKAGLTADQQNPINLDLLAKSEEGSVENVKALLKKEAMCIQDYKGESPLHKACRSEIEAFLKSQFLIAHDPKQIHLASKTKLFPIHLAAKNNDPKVLELLSKKCGVNLLTPKGHSALHIATFFGKIKNVRILLKNPAVNPEIKDKKGESVVHFAVFKNNSKILGLLLEHSKCQPNTKNNAGFTALHMAVQRKSTKCADILLRNQYININVTDGYGNTAAHYASMNECREILSLIQSNPKYDPSVKNKEGKSVDQVNKTNIALVNMCEYGTADNVRKLSLAGAKLIVDESGHTCMHRACASDITPIEKCKLLYVKNPEMINYTNVTGETPLHVSCRRPDSSLTKFLLDLPNIDANIKSSKYHAPLHVTAFNNNTENMAALLSHERILVNIQDVVGDTASHIAATYTRYKLLELLQKHPNYDSTVKNINNDDVVQILSRYSLTEITKFKWNEYKTVSIVNKFWPGTLSLIAGNLYHFTLKNQVVIYNKELDEIASFATSYMRPVRQVTGLKNAGLVVAAFDGLYHLRLTGALISKIASGCYCSVTTYRDKLYAVRQDYEQQSKIEVYTGDAPWQHPRVLLLPFYGYYHVTVLVTNKAIYACCRDAHKIYVLSDDGQVMQTLGIRGLVGPGELFYPHFCHSDSAGNILLADGINQRLQILSREHNWSLFHLPWDIDNIFDAVYLPGRLYVLHRQLNSSLSPYKLTCFS